MMKFKFICTIFICTILSANTFSQEVESDLIFMNLGGEKGGGSQLRGGSPAMSLPFLDDFAWASSYEESGIDRPELVRWDSSPVRRTSTFALNPPTIGVATLDGMDAGGYPYNFNSVDAHGWADTLTSRKLLLGSYTQDDQVTLSFWFQGGGVGNAPDPGEDSLVVEFKAVGPDGDIWTPVWSQTGQEATEFTQAVITIDNGVYFHNSFQFRFRNYGSLMGNTDLWHIDYVYVATNGATGNPQEELAFRDPAYTLLRNYSAMPWTHYSSNPEFYMRDSLEVYSNNFGEGPNNQENTGITLRLDAEGAQPIPYTNQFIQNVNVPVGPFTTEYLSTLLDADGMPSDVVFDTSLSDSIATFEVSLWEEEVGFYTDQTNTFDNDSIGFKQVFDNYYAYDDGTAEKAYALDSEGGQIAVRYPLAIADTLEGIAIHFTPFYENAEDLTFVLKVWEDDGGLPGAMIDTMYQFHNPQYFTDGYDQFAFYPMDNPVPVSGIIHVGLIQQQIDRLNIGLDKTTNANAGNLSYMLGPGASWNASGISGSVMIRPVLRAGKDAILSVEDLESGDAITFKDVVYPNPASTHFSITTSEKSEWSVYALSGKLIRSGLLSESVETIDVSDLDDGLYLVVTKGVNSGIVQSNKLIILK